MILPVTEVDSIRHIQKAHARHITAFESVFDKVERKEEERKERAKKQREKEKKDAINRRRKKEQERAAEAAKDRTDQTFQDEGSEDQSTSAGSVRTSNVSIGSTWAEVSPEAAANYMAAHTGVPSSRWLSIIYHESTNNPTVTNSIGCFGYLQLHPVHGAVSQMTPQQYLDTAVNVFNSQGLSAWEVVTTGRA